MGLETPSNATQPTTSAAGSEADGHSLTIGGTADASWSGAGAGTLVAILKAIWTRLRGGQATMANSLPVTLPSDQGVLISTPLQMANLLPGAIYASNQPYGYLRTSPESTSQFYDPFDAALDTVDRWNAASLSGAGAAAAVAAGNLTVNAGSAAAGYANLSSRPVFNAKIPGFIQVSWAMRLETPASNIGVLSGYRFWGRATTPGTPTATLPVTDGIGWEIGTDGLLRAVVWSAGVRVYQSAALTFPTDNAMHRFIVLSRTDRVWWYIDSFEVPIATVQWAAPQVQTLPVRMLAVNGAAATTNPTLICSGIAVADTGRNNAALSDGTFPWRTASVSAAGALLIRDQNDVAKQPVTFRFDGVVLVTAIALISGTRGINHAAHSVAATSHLVTTLKTFRITQINLELRHTGTTPNSVLVELRVQLGGAVTATSPIAWAGRIGSQSPTLIALETHGETFTFPDGLDIPAGAGFGLTQIATTNVTAALSGSIIGYEFTA